MQETAYQFDVLAVEKWQNYFINKVYNRVLRNLNMEDVLLVSICMEGDITAFKVEEHHGQGGYLYELLDSVLKSTLDVRIFTAQKTTIRQVIEIELPIKSERKRTPEALSAVMVSEVTRFKDAFERTGDGCFDMNGNRVKAGATGTLVYFGQAGLGHFMQRIGNQNTNPTPTFEMLITQFSTEANSPANTRGQRVVARFNEEAVQEALHLPKWRVVNGVPIFKMATKTLEIYIAPTFAVVKNKEQLSVLYNIDKGSSVQDAFAVLSKLKVPKAQEIAQIMDLRRTTEMKEG